MFLLDNPVQPYPWGRPGGIDRLVGRRATVEPQAELWVGTHHRGSSRVASGPEAGRSLAEVLAGDLPFLLKVLAIAEPLSVQAHPSAEQAATGFAREEAAGIAADAPERSYHDPNPKPEMLVALEPTYALCGFRPPGEAHALIQALGVPALSPLLDRLAQPGPAAAALESAFGWLVRLVGEDRRGVARAVAQAAGSLGDPRPTQPGHWLARLAASHPDDPLCVAPLLLELVVLAPGDAVHLPAGNLHAYLAGAGVEVMASSDNVLRGGLTAKHVDGEELLAVLCFEAGVPAAPVRRTVGAVTSYDADEAFAVGCIAPTGSATTLEIAAPSLLLPMGEGAVVARGPDVVEVAPGQAVYVDPGSPLEVTSAAPVWWAAATRSTVR